MTHQEETLQWLKDVAQTEGEGSDEQVEETLKRIEGFLRQTGRGEVQARALDALCALVERSAVARARVAQSAAWAQLLVALASCEAAAHEPTLRRRAMDALCAWGARAGEGDDNDPAWRALALVRDTAAAHGAVQTQRTAPRTHSTAQPHTELTAAQRTRLRRGGVDVDALAAEIAALRAVAAKRVGTPVPALVAPLTRAQRSVARLLGTDDVLRDPALVTALIAINTDIVDVLAEYDAFLLRSSPVFENENNAPTSVASAVAAAVTRPRSLSASASNILKFFSFGRRQAKEPQQEQQQKKAETDSNNGDPMLRPSKTALKLDTEEDKDEQAKAKQQQPDFIPVVSFSSSDELQQCEPSLVAREESAPTQEQVGDVLAEEWQGHHRGQDSLRESYLALYQCENL